MKPAKKLYFVEANISAGKTTLLKGCQKNSFAVYEEPLNIWKEEYVEKDGTNILGLFYSDMEKWSFPLEVTAFVTRIKELEKALISEEPLVIVERSVLVDYHVFAPNLREQGKISDLQWKIYEDWYKMAVKYILIPLLKNFEVEYIFVDADPVICWERKLKRDRKEEKPMPLEYLQSLHKRHRDWLLDADFAYPVHIIDGNASEKDVLKALLDILHR
jgi:deoxyadenosine/deoxycytidine kinase